MKKVVPIWPEEHVTSKLGKTGAATWRIGGKRLVKGVAYFWVVKGN